MIKTRQHNGATADDKLQVHSQEWGRHGRVDDLVRLSLPLHLMDIKDGEVLARRYRLETQIGRRKVGSVWKVWDTRENRPCVAKFAEGDAARSPQATARFEQEAEALSKLQSPNLPLVYHSGVWENVPFLIVEWFDGHDLTSLLTQRSRLSSNEVLAIHAGLSHALLSIHRAQIVHRDVRPGNVFLVGGRLDTASVRLLGFGTAKLDNSSGGTQIIADSDDASIAYASPELLQPGFPVTPAADLWSLAVLVVESLTGHRIFSSRAEILLHPSDSPALPSALDPSLASLDPWWRKATARDHAARYHSAEEQHSALRMALAPPQAAPVKLKHTMVSTTNPLLALSVLPGSPQPGDAPGPAGVPGPAPSALVAAAPSTLALRLGAGGTVLGEAPESQVDFSKSTSKPAPPPPSQDQAASPSVQGTPDGPAHTDSAPPPMSGPPPALVGVGILLLLLAVGGALLASLSSSPTAPGAPPASAH